MKPNLLTVTILTLGSFLAFLLAISDLVVQGTKASSLQTLSTAGNATHHMVFYPSWFFPLFVLVTLVTLIGLSSTLSAALVHYVQGVGTSSRWNTIRLSVIDVRGGEVANGAGLIQWGLSLTALYSAIAFVGEEMYLVALHGASATIGYVSIIPGVRVMGVSVFIFGIAYIFLILPRYGSASMWVLGLMWGFAECVWNGEIALIHFSSIAPDVSNPLWWMYIASISSLFFISAFLLRHRLRKDRVGAAMLGAVLAFTPVRFLITSFFAPSLTFAAQSTLAIEVLTSQLPWYFLILVVTLRLVRR